MLIGDVSKKYNIGIETLRYYDKIGVLSVKRIKNNSIIPKKILINLKVS